MSFYHSPEVADRQFVDLLVGGTIAGGQVEGVNHVVARVAQPVRQPAEELCINQEVHPRTGTVRLT